MLKKICLMAGVFILLWSFVLQPAMAEEDAVSREIITILYKNGDISDETRRELLDKLEKADPKKPVLNASWNNGMRLESEDGAFKLQIGGRILNDWAATHADQSLEQAFDGQTLEGTGTEMRHARFCMGGILYNQFTFKADYDFAGTAANFKDVWIGLKNIPGLGELRVGHQKEPFSMETMNSLPYTTFMERGLPVAFVPGRNTGVTIHDSLSDGRLGWGVGVFKDVSDSDGFDDQSDYNVTGRVTGMLFADEDRSRLVHLGAAYSHQFRDEENSLRYRSKPGANMAEVYVVDTGSIKGVTDVDLMGPEIALVSGPFSVQAEYVHAWLNRTAADNLDFYGYYAFCSYFLTGEHRIYKMDEAGGEFSRMIPIRPFQFKGGGWGAWEVALRYGFMDGNDGEIQGGQEQNYTLGVNWYMNPNLRVMFNYVLARINDRDIVKSDAVTVIDGENTESYMMRFQVDF